MLLLVHAFLLGAQGPPTECATFDTTVVKSVHLRYLIDLPARLLGDARELAPGALPARGRPMGALLDHLEGTLRIERSRECLTGLSMGAFGAWELAMGTPERSAAV